ncbi:nuclear transport factor 2 family protein [Novosphingobium sp. G106]|uniref:nuclear transport factor 2 family protein n=1 Tax=Novosphingobium sp. G106 TaxID=2849500 RepID=UPI001C2DD614|nr:nuclear transport factor 2 family protein [Novosphingobium sp. G106]MBV1686211.1 nuclear transport factor 2 family protein [Novosphingobium sp. G106]
MRNENVLDIVFDHLAAGDVAAALEWLSPDAHISHCFDRIAHDREGTAREWARFVDNFPGRTFTDIRSQPTASGFIRQHVMTVRTADGHRLSWEVCVVVVMDGERIKRLDEYLDRAGSFSPAA